MTAPGDEKKAEWVTPLVAYLASDLCDATGGLFDTGLGQAGELRYLKSRGAYFDPAGFTAEDVRDRWGEIEGFAGVVPAYTEHGNLEIIARNPWARGGAAKI
ncbi:hypothetical protein DFJ74DRAFT_705530 [Hyaloraphidium curvatum]|nr:hypothetical protein DFJ74DRAFT_705530 [Hyaloraphidium curvatum]